MIFVASTVAEMKATPVVPALTKTFGGRLGLEEVRARESQLMRDREARLGPYRGHALVGSLPRDEGRVETIVRVDFERGSVYNVFEWGPAGRLLRIQASPVAPATRYVPVSETELVAFRPGEADPRPRLSFEGEGGTAVLVLHGPDGPLRLARVP